ncbi:hypothetical protein DERP_002148 [Dermatophagoides pteronyssinus]|uniref:Uncharacterized protein n=1 Tax=Dermatophagoides pteronyssinus TaxID=6956 RepID=A0ABQ8JGY0_DERPT|nr:hypothetical protein DERP_002148 [Dermatophagoides pteronyssinus]
MKSNASISLCNGGVVDDGISDTFDSFIPLLFSSLELIIITSSYNQQQTKRQTKSIVITSTQSSKMSQINEVSP